MPRRPLWASIRKAVNGRPALAPQHKTPAGTRRVLSFLDPDSQPRIPMTYLEFRSAVAKQLPRQRAYNWWVGTSALYCRYRESVERRAQWFWTWWHVEGKALAREHLSYASF